MRKILSRKFQIGWGIWALVLGVSLAFVSLFQDINSFGEYIRAFILLDMPNSWCPTLLTLFGLSSLLGEKVKYIKYFTGLVLLPVGLYATYEFTFQNTGDPIPICLYAQTIHITEVLTGIFTVLTLTNKK